MSEEKEIPLQEFTCEKEVQSKSVLRHWLLAPQRFFASKFSAGSLKGSIFTTIASTVGAGILTLPYVMELGGLYLGIAVFIAAMLVSLYTCVLLVVCSEKSGRATYESLGAYAYGPWMAKFAEINMIINNYATVVAYIVLVQTLFPAAFHFMGVSSDSILRSKYFWGPVITAAVTFPLSLAKMISILRYSSLMSFIAVVYVTIIILIEFFYQRRDNTTPTFTGAEPVEVTVYGIFEGFPIVIFAYTCHPNVLPIYSVLTTQELQRRSVRRGVKFLYRGLVTVMTMYLIVGIFGYLTLYHGAHGRSNFPQIVLTDDVWSGNTAMVVVRSRQAIFSIAITALCGTPLLVYPCRDALYSTLGWQKSQISRMRHFLTVSGTSHTVIVFSALGLALVAPGMGIVLGIIGSISGPVICFTLPCLFYAGVFKGKWTRPDLLLCWVVNIGITGLSFVSFVILVVSLAGVSV